MFSIYSGWSNKRNEIYEKKNWYLQNYYWEDLEYQYKSGQDKNINPMNVILDDISDEDFIEKNLMLTDEEAKKINEEDTSDNITSSSNSDNSNTSSNIDSSKKLTKDKNKLDNIQEPVVTYGFGKPRY